MGSPPPPPGAPGAATGGVVLAGRYRLIAPIATGGMARVWRARDETLARDVAVKVLHAHLATDTTFVTRFRAEALAAARLGHPSVVSIYDTCSADGIEAIVMELIDGPTLRARLDAEGRLAPAEAARIAARIADALVVAHRAGIVHRDIKPANVLLATDGRVLVTDFGIAKAAEAGDLTGERQMLGTAKYLAPEQVRAQPVDGRTDVYALGVVLFEMVCGRPPFLADTDAGTALARLQEDPPDPRALRPELEPSFAAAISRAIARDPSHRWPDAASFAQALRALAAGQRLAPPPPAPPPVAPAAPPPSRAAPRVPPPADGTDPREWRHPDPPPTGGAGPAAPPPTQVASPAAPEERPDHRPALAIIAVALTVLVVVGVLGWRLVGAASTTRVTPVAAAFDPFRDDGENDADAPLAVDGDPATAWSTETYRDPEISTAVNKPGVGLLLDLGETRAARRLRIESPTSGWTAEVYVLDDLPDDDISAWGEPLDRQEDIGGDTGFSLGGARGRHVILWITRTGPDGVVEIADAVVEVDR